MFIGRKKELQFLENYLSQKRSIFGVIKGRRRVGKSTLVREASSAYDLFEFVGLPPDKSHTTQTQKDEFIRQMKEYSFETPKEQNDWGSIFHSLAKQLPRRGRVVVFFDEISWMAKLDPLFLGKLKTEWDKAFSQNPHVLLVLCGSISSWIEKNILSSTAFVGRVSFTLDLKPLTLAECNLFWGNRKDRISYFEKLDILSITGGIPKYLQEIDFRKTALENISKLCFQAGGFLFEEYHKGE